ncbi:pyruvate kinase 2, cytosolic-like [Arachis duranensis]|uniref:pyruvate kinase n=1 Tax=Arachis duranensis TaxID=130453 RepID=A0A9C6U0Z5_ARADU|nr:pyruvate kinase 2, cytosolic-like [Arachis duranensis]
MAGKPAVLTCVVDSMTDNLRPTRAEATDVANAVLDGSDAILLGAETLRGLYPIETISTFGGICSEKDKFNPRCYVAAATDNMSLQKAQLLENSLADQSVRYPAIPDGHEIRKTKLKTMIEVSRGSE